MVLKVYASQIHAILEETLQAVGAKAMVVGHTPQTVGVNWYGNTLHCGYIISKLFGYFQSLTILSKSCSKYNSGIWRIDVGMSSGVLNSRPEVNLKSMSPEINVSKR